MQSRIDMLRYVTRMIHKSRYIISI